MWTTRALASLACLTCLAGSGAGPALALECRDLTFESSRFTMCEADAGHDAIRLFRAGPDGQPFGNFQALQSSVDEAGLSLDFAMNGGMYHENRAPVGHYIEDGTEEMRVIANAGPGNFGLLPNGVFCIRDGRADVIETRRYLDMSPGCRHATQSGPMLVIDGALHPRFLPDSTSRKIRNGVGTGPDGRRVIFAISNTAVTFHKFARLFRDHLRLNQALFLDGSISRFYAPQINRTDPGRPMGPIVAVTSEK